MMEYLKDVVSLRFNPELCTGCGRCLEVCPQDVFKRSGKDIEIQQRDRCIECGACMMNCQPGAVTVNAGVGCAAAVITGMLRKTEPTCDCDGGSCC